MSQKVIVFLHGSPGRASLWKPLIALGPADVRCVAFDLLDHGDAEKATSATLHDVLDDVVERVSAIDGPVTLVGHSLGAWIAGRAIPRLNEGVERFVALAGVYGLDAELAGRSEALAAALETGTLTLDAAVAVATELWLPTGQHRPEHAAAIAGLVHGEGPQGLARALRRHVELADPANWVAQHSVPTTVLHNAGDRGVPITIGRALAALSRGHFIELDGDGHYPHWTHTTEVAAAVFGG